MSNGLSPFDFIMIAVAAIVCLATLNRRLLRMPFWRAMLTPLASIIGSGFLVVGPILAHIVGDWAWLAMLGLCVAAYLFGSAIRWNIRYVEPLMAGHPPHPVALIEHASQYALAFAYFVSVTYYLNLLAAFALRAVDIVDPNMARLLASAVIVALGLLGALRGLHALENVEAGAVGLKLGLIAGLLAALGAAGFVAFSENRLTLPQLLPDVGLPEIGMLLGLIILVQGFETSRYLGDQYNQTMRIRSMRAAQFLSSAIYIAFILLITPFFTAQLPVEGGETAIIDMLLPLGIVVAPLLIFAALASQLSAAVADMNGAGGLLADATGHRMRVRASYLATAGVALAITWSANIYEIIVYASKAFVIYYALQCVLATLICLRHGDGRSPGRAALFSGGLILCLFVLVFGIAVEG